MAAAGSPGRRCRCALTLKTAARLCHSPRHRLLALGRGAPEAHLFYVCFLCQLSVLPSPSFCRPQDDKKVDIYSYGNVLFELASRKVPWPEETDAALLTQKILDGERPGLAHCAGTPLTYLALMEQCWSDAAAIRPDADTLIARASCQVAPSIVTRTVRLAVFHPQAKRHQQ